MAFFTLLYFSHFLFPILLDLLLDLIAAVPAGDGRDIFMVFVGLNIKKDITDIIEVQFLLDNAPY